VTTLFERAYWNAFVLWHARNETRVPFLPLEQILETQNERVRAIVKHAYDTVPFYRDAMDAAHLRPNDFRSAADLSKLPLISNDQVAFSPERFISSRFTRDSALGLTSSGTQGIKKQLFYDHAALMHVLAHGHRIRVVLARFVGRMFGYREMTIERLDGTGVKLRHFYSTHALVPSRMDFKRESIAPSHTVKDIVAVINHFAPDVIRGYGTHLGLIFREAYWNNLALVKPKALLYGADLMPEADRRLIEAEFHVPVLSTYQAAEALRIAYQCERREGYHISLDQVAVRVVDRDGNPVSNGKPGEIVISNLMNHATVLLNYKVGDIVTLADQLCECGRTLPMIGKIQGRSDDMVILPDGRIFHALVLVPPLQAIDGVIQTQVVQTDPSHFLIRVVCSQISNWDGVQNELAKRAFAILGNTVSLDISRVEMIPPESSDKVRSVISYRRE
jgi:phenylacetate-coenzyme A ligase PaaK-like adenylate-forming protein